MANELCKIANDVSEKYVYSVGVYIYILVKYAPQAGSFPTQSHFSQPILQTFAVSIVANIVLYHNLFRLYLHLNVVTHSSQQLRLNGLIHS
jgi:hypothetical protein